METDQIECDFLKIKKVIGSVEHGGQIDCCERLIKLFIDKHFNDDFTSDEEASLESFKKQLIVHLKYKKIKHSIIDDDY